jgi:hypothetical protein
VTHLATQLSLLSLEQEASAYHDTARSGYFTLLANVAKEGNRKRQSCHRLVDMPVVLNSIDKGQDTWLSQAEFVRPNRRVVNVARVGLLFTDLDTYRTPWAANKSPDALAREALFFCAYEGIPTPSILVFSGRGLQAKWLLDATVPRQGLIDWNNCQNHLVQRLSYLGADKVAKDASRVLRVVHTVNTKSNEVCRVVHVQEGLDGLPVRYSFEYLTEVLQPAVQQGVAKSCDEREVRRQLRVIQGTKAGNLRHFSGRRLAWDRLEDMRKLAAMRGGVQEGQRMVHLLWRLNFLLLSGAAHSSTMYQEAAVLARELDPQWNCRSSELMTLYSKAKAHESGERIEFNGKQYSPLYTPRNDTLINMLEITSDEQRGLRTLISHDMALERRHERDRQRNETRRRTAGAQVRKDYLANVDHKRTQTLELRQTGLSIRDIAKQIGISKTAVGRYLKPF